MCNTEKSQKENSKQLDNVKKDVILESTPYGKIYMKFVKTLILISFLLIPVVSYGVDSDVELDIFGIPKNRISSKGLPYEVRERFGSVPPKRDGLLEEMRDEVVLSFYSYMDCLCIDKFSELIENNPQLQPALGDEKAFNSFTAFVRKTIRVLFVPAVIAFVFGIFYAPALFRKFDGMISGLFKRNA